MAEKQQCRGESPQSDQQGQLRERHMNSHTYESNKERGVRNCRRLGRFVWFHKLSTRFALVQFTGFTKFLDDFGFAGYLVAVGL